MIGDFYVAKLNLSPKVISAYKKNKDDIKGMEQLKKIVVINELNNIFSTSENEFTNKLIKKYTHTEENIKKNIKESEIYISFKKAQSDLLSGYEEVVEKSQKNKGIFWPNKFLNETKPKMKKELYKIKKEFPILDQVILNISDDTVKNNIPGNSNFGHGRKYLLDAEKIKFFLIDNNIKSFDGNYSFYYEVVKERILVPCEEGENMFKRIIFDIQEQINGNDGNIGSVHIIPIYEDFEVDKAYKNVTFEVVYPNNPERTDDIDRVLDPTFQESGADKIEVKMHSNENKFDGSLIGKLARNSFGATKGYLKTIKSEGKDIVFGKIKRVMLGNNDKNERVNKK